jgi:hypothetical protein
LNPRDIHNSRLDALNAAKDIARESGRDVKLSAVSTEQRVAERRMRGAEGDGVDRRAVARAQTGANMISADGLSERDPLLGQSKHWFRIALAEWPGLLDTAQKLETNASPGERGVDDQRIVEASGLDGSFERLIEKSAKIVEPIARQSHAGGHGVPAAFDRQAQIDGAPHRRSKIDIT